MKFVGSNLKIGDTNYCLVGLNRNNELVIDVEKRTGIHYWEVRRSRIKRKVSKELTIRLSGYTVDVSDVAGIRFHLGTK